MRVSFLSCNNVCLHSQTSKLKNIPDKNTFYNILFNNIQLRYLVDFGSGKVPELHEALKDLLGVEVQLHVFFISFHLVG